MEYAKIAVNRKEVCNMANKKRILSAALAVLVLFVVLYSVFFIAAESHHDCIGENCPICYQISVCENTLRNISLAVCAMVFAIALIYTLCGSVSACAGILPSYTLVSLKVKLTD